MMIPLTLCSLLMVTICLERLFFLRQRFLFPEKELERLKAYADLHASKLNELEIEAKHPVGRILKRALHHFPTSAQRFQELLQDQARRELHQMERGLVMLEIIVGVAPLLGLLGTALGMIEVFGNLALVDGDRNEVLSRGISQALLTTVVGLGVGIPALIAFNLFSRKISSLSLRIEQEVLFFYYKLFPQQK